MGSVAFKVQQLRNGGFKHSIDNYFIGASNEDPIQLHAWNYRLNLSEIMLFELDTVESNY